MSEQKEEEKKKEAMSFSEFQEDEVASYFSKIMSGESDKVHQGLVLDFLQMFTVMFYNVFEAFMEDLYKDKDSAYKEITREFPDYVVGLWLERIKEQTEKDLKEYDKYTGSTDTGKLMGNLFGNMLGIKEKLESYLQKADKVGEMFRETLKSGRTIKKDV